MPMNFVAAVLGCSAFFFGALRHIYGDLAWAGVYIALGGLAALLLVSSGRVRWNDFFAFKLFVFLMMLVGLGGVTEEGLQPLFYLIVMISAFIVGKLLVVEGVFFRVSVISFWSASIFILVVSLASGFDRDSYDQVFEHASRNRLGAYLVITAVSAAIACYWERGRVVVYPSVIALLLSLPLYGRASIISSFMFFAVSIIARFGLRGAILLQPFFILIVVAFQHWGIWEALISETNLSRGIESPRTQMAIGYMANLDLAGFFLGAPMGDIELINQYNGNPHNSFVRLHSLYGVFPIVVILFFFLRRRHAGWPRLFLLSCCAILVFRISLDTIAFGDYLDHLIFASILALGSRGCGNCIRFLHEEKLHR